MHQEKTWVVSPNASWWEVSTIAWDGVRDTIAFHDGIMETQVYLPADHKVAVRTLHTYLASGLPIYDQMHIGSCSGT